MKEESKTRSMRGAVPTVRRGFPPSSLFLHCGPERLWPGQRLRTTEQTPFQGGICPVCAGIQGDRLGNCPE
jgi:hypothetical protein